MPLYYYKTDESGRSYLEEVDLGAVTKKVEIKRPEVNVGRTTKLYKCTLCPDTKFKTAGLMARHFNETHQDKKVTKDSWREHHEVVDGPESG